MHEQPAQPSYAPPQQAYSQQQPYQQQGYAQPSYPQQQAYGQEYGGQYSTQYTTPLPSAPAGYPAAPGGYAQGYGAATGYAQPGYPPAAAPAGKGGKSHTLLWSILALVVVVAVLVVLSAVLKVPSGLYPKQLKHTAVEAYIGDSDALGAPSGVVCNGGKNIKIEKGKTFSCTSDDGDFEVTMLDNDGGYRVQPKG